MSRLLMEIFGYDEINYESAKAFELLTSEQDDFESVEQIPDWIKELPDYPDPFNEFLLETETND